MTEFLQSPAWERFNESLGRRTFTNVGSGWHYMAIEEKGTLNTRLYTPYGPVVRDTPALDEAIKSLRALAKARGATFARIEPTSDITRDELRRRGLKPVTYQQLQPEHSQVIDLTREKDELLAAMSQNTRNITRNYHKKGVTIAASYEPADIKILTTLLDKVAARNSIKVHASEYYLAQAKELLPSKDAALYTARLEDGTPIAAALVYDSPTTRYYAHAAADDEYRKLSAGTALVGQMILDAKDKGLKKFDLYGTTTSTDKNHPWYGFTKFKKSFGGEPVEYLGAWDIPVNRTGYRMYRIHQTLRRKLR